MIKILTGNSRRHQIVSRINNPSVFLLFGFLTLYACADQDSNIEPALPALHCNPYIKLGYTNKVSYYPDEKVVVFLQSDQWIYLCRLNIFDINGELIFSVASPLTIQEENTENSSVNGFQYKSTITLDLPGNIRSGIYQIENMIPFIVKTREKVDLMILYPSNTVNAYCESGGKSLYSATHRPTEVSFERPMVLQDFAAPCLKWFTTLSDYSIGYIADVDLDHYSSVDNSSILVIAGHSEYWTRAARLNFDEYISTGHNALILSGNTMWWQVRYADDTNNLICHRQLTDPVSDPLLATINWNDPSLQYSILSSIGADFRHGGYGLKTDKGWNGYKITSPTSPLLDGLNLKAGDTLALPTVEYDGAPIHHFDADGYPIIDKDSLQAYKVELIGFDKGFRVKETYGTFFVMQQSIQSGIIVNTGSSDWCSNNGMGGKSGEQIKRITYNAIEKILNHKSMFSN